MAAAAKGPRVFTVPPGAPFLATLADVLLAGELVPFDRADPLAVAGVTVLLPTRRAVRAFADHLAARLGPEAALLPAIRPIGDIDEEDHLLDSAAAETAAERLILPATIAPLTRRLALTRLTLAWASHMRLHPLGLPAEPAPGKPPGKPPGEPLRIPASAADALRLAGDLARLIDDMETAGVDAAALAGLAPEDHAEYFRFTLNFLKIVTEAWPAYLDERHLVDPAIRRDTLIRARAERLAKAGASGPIVAAGSTGSIPATAELLRAIAHLPQGAVVLPGLDRHIDAAGWEAIGADAAPAHGHPQHGLRQLIATIGVAREDIVPLGSAPAPARVALLSEAIRPASTLEAWAAFTPGEDALAGADLIVARNEQEEATAIAVAIREAVEAPEATVALVTPDRALARRVAVELRRWNLAVDDSAGVRLERERHGVFARLLADAAAADGDPVALLALLKHPFARFGMPRALCRRAAGVLELALFRGHRVPGGVARLAEALARAEAEAAADWRTPVARKRLTPEDWRLADRLVACLVDCLSPLEGAARAGAPLSAAALAGLLTEALSAAAQDETGDTGPLWTEAGGTALARLLENLATDEEATTLLLPPADLPFFLGALLADVSVQRPVAGEPRVHIWGALEARLQSVDCLILGGLDEGVWPSEPHTDPWLSRAMRNALGLPAPERRIGLSAHDFFQHLAAPRVIVSRAGKRGGAPTVESRWLQRLHALAGSKQAEAFAARGARYLALARALDRAAETVPVKRPEPRPPLAARPAGLSITEIETLIRDPYAVYAKHVLRLQPLDPLGRVPDAGLRGTLLHEALGRFTGEWRGPYDAAAEARLLAIGAETLAAIADFPDVHAVWSIRFAAIARWLVAFEAARSAKVAARHAEISGTLDIPAGDGVFTLRGRADRVDVMADGSVAIYDYKTGTPQTDRSVFAGLTPQMTLEAAMVRHGGFEKISEGASVSELAWLAIGKVGRGEPYISAVTRKDKVTADGLAEQAIVMLAGLVGAFRRPGHPYASRLRPRMESTRYQSDYDHLARVREWALVESDEDIAALGNGNGAP